MTMKNVDKAAEPSMEDILSSIRRIVSEDPVIDAPALKGDASARSRLNPNGPQDDGFDALLDMVEPVAMKKSARSETSKADIAKSAMAVMDDDFDDLLEPLPAVATKSKKSTAVDPVMPSAAISVVKAADTHTADNVALDARLAQAVGLNSYSKSAVVPNSLIPMGGAFQGMPRTAATRPTWQFARAETAVASLGVPPAPQKFEATGPASDSMSTVVLPEATKAPKAEVAADSVAVPPAAGREPVHASEPAGTLQVAADALRKRDVAAEQFVAASIASVPRALNRVGTDHATDGTKDLNEQPQAASDSAAISAKLDPNGIAALSSALAALPFAKVVKAAVIDEPTKAVTPTIAETAATATAPVDDDKTLDEPTVAIVADIVARPAVVATPELLPSMAVTPMQPVQPGAVIAMVATLSDELVVGDAELGAEIDAKPAQEQQDIADDTHSDASPLAAEAQSDVVVAPLDLSSLATVTTRLPDATAEAPLPTPAGPAAAPPSFAALRSLAQTTSQVAAYALPAATTTAPSWALARGASRAAPATTTDAGICEPAASTSLTSIEALFTSAKPKVELTQTPPTVAMVASAPTVVEPSTSAPLADGEAIQIENTTEVGVEAAIAHATVDDVADLAPPTPVEAVGETTEQTARDVASAQDIVAASPLADVPTTVDDTVGLVHADAAPSLGSAVAVTDHTADDAAGSETIDEPATLATVANEPSILGAMAAITATAATAAVVVGAASALTTPDEVIALEDPNAMASIAEAPATVYVDAVAVVEPALVMPMEPMTGQSVTALETALETSRPFVPPALPPAASARTLEDAVVDLLRPMLRSWIDANMPVMVEKALRAETSAIAPPVKPTPAPTQKPN
jgi:uncharacterized protein